jgi:hypothetical protein
MIDENERKNLLAFVEQLQDDNLLREIALVLGIDVSKWNVVEPSLPSDLKINKGSN